MKIHMITHNDLDALGCIVLAKQLCSTQAPLRKLDVEYWLNGYDTIDDCIKRVLGFIRPDDFLLIGDICPSEETLDLIEQIPNTKILVDHHKTREKLNQKYPWVHIQEGLCGTARLHQALSNREVAGLTFYEGSAKLLSAMDQFVQYVDDYDNYRLEYIQSERLNRLQGVLGAPRFLEEAAVDFSDILDRYELVLKILEDKDREYIENATKRAIIRQVDDRRVGIAFAEQCISALASAILKEYPEVEAAIIINAARNTVSVRSRKNERASDILSTSRGGGGHAQASGWQMPRKLQDTLIESIFGYLGD